MQTLEQQISIGILTGFIPIEVGLHITNNINPKFELRPYQKEAFARFNYVLKQDTQRQKPTQLLFHMATGSGKTLIMVGVILDLYRQGYSNFIFFVNSSNIIEKTRDNFLNTLSSKYLFNETVSIADNQIIIKEVANFETANQRDINIIFTTIQGLHTRLNNPKENSLTLEDFREKKVVLLSDEAHHINAETKKGKRTKEEKENILSWESTIYKIFNSNPENLLLEFTATADLHHPEIKKKYFNKLLFNYPLKQFCKDQYSKEVQVLQADLPPFERALQAVILNQYRKKIFESYQLNIKPVILLKSKTINESKQFYVEFISKIQRLKPITINRIRNHAKNTIVQRVFDYLDRKNITVENFISELIEDFSPDKCISINSKDDSVEKQLIINNLEDVNNEIRAVFAVDKLNEGWDVLNLFDIVKLYNSRDANHKQGKIGKTTMSEAQLIGRGARYCPFKLIDTQPLYKRKYDDDIENELRICEELYYHSAHNPKYISELNKALIAIGIKSTKIIQKSLYIKNSFKDTNIYKNGVLYVNKRLTHNRTDIYELDKAIREKTYNIKFLTGHSSVSNVLGNDSKKYSKKANQIYLINTFEQHILRKALNKLPFYKFNNLQKYFPNLKSISQFLTSDKYVFNIKIEIEGTPKQINNLTNQMKLDAIVKVFGEIAQEISKKSVIFKGSEVFIPRTISSIFKDKVLNVVVNKKADQEYGTGQTETTNTDLNIDLLKEDWYVFNDNYGTFEEKHFVKYFKQAYKVLSRKYEEIYLIKNERYFKLYTFDEGQAFEPSFVLILKEQKNKKSIIHQVFIESKAKLTNENSIIKEKFLQQLSEKYQLEVTFENEYYKLLGISLYNDEKNKTIFQNLFN